ncbi:MAG: hypothetical protein MJZ16_11110 [Bacteroidales bacterium]|nr:hypothetical protein [Bacteroidales bacterium]
MSGFKHMLLSVMVLLTVFCQSALAQKAESMYAPYIYGIESQDFFSLCRSLSMNGTKFQIDKVNWPKSYPYAPSCKASIAFGDEGIAVVFDVRGYDLKAEVLEDNGKVYKDSCCEFFILSQDGKSYYNFEINCIGTLHAALGPDINTRELLPEADMSKIVRYSNLKKEKVNKPDGNYYWRVAMVIPFEVIGIDPSNLPESISCNFYKCADETNHPHYVSWSPVGTEKPNFHAPDYFGKVILNRYPVADDDDEEESE